MSQSHVGQDRRAKIEPLEDRLALAGDVAAFVELGVLKIRGDQAANGVEVRQLSDGRFQVAGTAGTTINRGSEPVVLANVIDINAQMRGGNDEFGITLQANRSVRNVSIDMGQGQTEKAYVSGGKSITGNLTVVANQSDSLQFSTFGRPLHVVGNTTILGGKSETVGDRIRLLGSYGNVVIETGLGPDTVNLGANTAGTSRNLFTAKKVTAKLGAGNDTLNLHRGTVDEIFADLGAGNDSLGIVSFTFPSNPSKARLVGGEGQDKADPRQGVVGTPRYDGFETLA